MNKQREASEQPLRHCGTQPLETPRLLLRRFQPDDAESARRNWAGDAEVQSGYGEPVYDTPEQAAALIRGYAEKAAAPDYYRWAVLERKSDACVGQIAFFLVESRFRFCEIEYCIGTAFAGQGYATEATRAVTAFGFETVGFHRIQACCRENNLASRRVIEKSGFVYEGTLRDFFLRADGYHDRLYFSLLRQEYENSKEHKQ